MIGKTFQHQQNMDKKNILITGATGMVGSQALQHLLHLNEVEKIISVGRRETGIQNTKLKEITHNNFLDLQPLREELKQIDVCIYCLAVYQNQVSKEKYEEITCGYQKALTDILEETSPKATFTLFGAAGADSKEKSKTTFAKIKGRAENLLLKTSFPEKYIFRPGYIHPTGNRKPPGLAYKLMLPVLGFLFKLFPSLGITDKALAKAMVTVSLDGGDLLIYENSDIRKINKLP